jgi:chromosome segregation ATPase
MLVEQMNANSANTNQKPSGLSAGSSISNLLGNNRKTTEKLAELKRQNEELRSLEKLRPQLLDLQQQLASSRSGAEEQKERYEEEIATLTDHNEQLSAATLAYKNSYEAAKADATEASAIVQQLTDRVKHLESEGRQLSIDLEEARYATEYIKEHSADPAVVKQQERRIQELEGVLDFDGR